MRARGCLKANLGSQSFTESAPCLQKGGRGKHGHTMTCFTPFLEEFHLRQTGFDDMLQLVLYTSVYLKGLELHVVRMVAAHMAPTPIGSTSS